MSRLFATTLRRVIDDEFDGNITEFARQAGVPQSAAAYYTRAGKTGRFPSPTQFEKILQPMSKASRAEVTLSYLNDMMPPSAHGLVMVKIPRKAGIAEPPQHEVKLPEKTEAAFAFLRDMATESGPVRRWIEISAQTMRGV